MDTVRYGQRDWKERYYSSKLQMPRQDEAARRSVAAHYVQGLCWVLMYYYQGVQDWGWYFPFHYAPCASDLVDLADFAGGERRGDLATPLFAPSPPSSLRRRLRGGSRLLPLRAADVRLPSRVGPRAARRVPAADTSRDEPRLAEISRAPAAEDDTCVGAAWRARDTPVTTR